VTDTALTTSRDAAWRDDGLYITDAELIRRMGVPEKRARQLLKGFDNLPNSAFPKKDRLFGGRRYWPAVKLYLDRRNKVIVDASQQRDAQND